MANKRYDQFAAVTPTTSRIILHADPSTGALGKCTIADELALQPSLFSFINGLQQKGSQIIASCLDNPFTFGNTTDTLFDQVAQFNMLACPACTSNGAWYMSPAAGVFTGNNFNGLALYSESSGVLTQIATTANDPNIWKHAGPIMVKVPWTASVSLSAGAYWLAFLYCRSTVTTAPTYFYYTKTFFSGTQALDLPNSLKISCDKSAQTTLPASLNFNTTVSNTFSYPIMGIY